MLLLWLVKKNVYVDVMLVVVGTTTPHAGVVEGDTVEGSDIAAMIVLGCEVVRQSLLFLPRPPHGTT